MNTYTFIILISLGIALATYSIFRDHPVFVSINKFLGSLGLDPYHNPLARPITCGDCRLIQDCNIREMTNPACDRVQKWDTKED